MPSASINLRRQDVPTTSLQSGSVFKYSTELYNFCPHLSLERCWEDEEQSNSKSIRRWQATATHNVVDRQHLQKNLIFKGSWPSRSIFSPYYWSSEEGAFCGTLALSTLAHYPWAAYLFLLAELIEQRCFDLHFLLRYPWWHSNVLLFADKLTNKMI